MHIFISWSKPRSRQVAEAVDDWLNRMFMYSVDTFMSENDIEAGVDWFRHITGNLAKAQFGIVCVTPENLDSRWLNYEAGALANHLTPRTDGSEPDQVRVVPLVWGMKKTNVIGPLGNRHAVELNEIGMRSIATSVNSEIEAIHGTRVEGSVLDKQFVSLWPEVDTQLTTIPRDPPGGTELPERDPASKLDELLGLARRQSEANRGQPLPRRVDQSATAYMELWKLLRGPTDDPTAIGYVAEMGTRGYAPREIHFAAREAWRQGLLSEAEYKAMVELVTE